MTQKELLETLIKTTGYGRSVVESVIKALIAQVTDNLIKGEQTRLSGFAVFKVSQRLPRKGRNPKTGESVDVAASKAMTVQALTELKTKLNPHKKEVNDLSGKKR